MSAITYWRNRVGQHHVQSIKAQETLGDTGDMWRSMTDRFTDDPRRTDDPVLDRLLPWVTPESTVLDVGGGAGRFALPLALHCRHVTVVEPSESMVAALSRNAEAAGIENLSVVSENWEEAQVEPADLVLAAHVVYGVTEIGPFIRKLTDHARQRVALAAFMESPLSQTAPFWQRVHGEERILLPALPEIMNVLWELDIYPDVSMLPPTAPRAVPNREAATAMLRRWLYIAPDSAEDRRLETALDDLLVETPQGLLLREARPQRQGIISWKPEG
jgi:2-polyprenyl-3-methyl-5-hydroxy-6-metoxy-1,4-benzoquinol methylase